MREKDGVLGNDTGDMGRKQHSGNLRLGNAWISFSKRTKNFEAKHKSINQSINQ